MFVKDFSTEPMLYFLDKWEIDDSIRMYLIVKSLYKEIFLSSNFYMGQNLQSYSFSNNNILFWIRKKIACTCLCE